MMTELVQPEVERAPVEVPLATNEPGGEVFRAPLLDPGWLLLVPGIVLIAFTLLLPAYHDLLEARHYRDNLGRVEAQRQERMGNYDAFLKSVERGDESTILGLAAVNLNMAPEGRHLLMQNKDVAQTSASVFGRLEPRSVALPRFERRLSTLEKWSLDRESRVWLLLAGATMVFVGLLPPTPVGLFGRRG